MKRFETIGAADHEPPRRARCRATRSAPCCRDPQKKQRRGADPRPVLRHRARLHPPQPRGRRRDRRHRSCERRELHGDEVVDAARRGPARGARDRHPRRRRSGRSCERHARHAATRTRPADRPDDPAGTRPRHDPRDLLPARQRAAAREIDDADVVDGDAVDVTDGEPDARSARPRRRPAARARSRAAGAPGRRSPPSPRSARAALPLPRRRADRDRRRPRVLLAVRPGRSAATGSDRTSSGRRGRRGSRPATSAAARSRSPTHVGERVPPDRRQAARRWHRAGRCRSPACR